MVEGSGFSFQVLGGVPLEAEEQRGPYTQKSKLASPRAY